MNCGGGHRIWQIAIMDPRSDQDVCIDPHSARFEFISKGALIQMDLNLSTVDIISVWNLNKFMIDGVYAMMQRRSVRIV